jgi:hypothetical protein
MHGLAVHLAILKVGFLTALSIKPGMMALETTAITHDVKIAIGKANPIISPRHFQNW